MGCGENCLEYEECPVIFFHHHILVTMTIGKKYRTVKNLLSKKLKYLKYFSFEKTGTYTSLLYTGHGTT